MDKKSLQTYAIWSKQYLEQQIELSLKSLGIHSDDDIRDAKRVGDVTVIDGDSTSYPAELYGKRDQIIKLVKESGYNNIIEEFAYTWFNRFVALRFMEVHGFLSHGFRILSNPAGGIEPEILKNLNFVKGELNLDLSICEDYKQQGKIEELFKYVLIKQCNNLADKLPMLFSTDMGYLEYLLPPNLLKGDTVITKLVEIPEEVFLDDIEVIGWMYQFYISSKKDAVYASKKTITKETLPAVTQLFTPDWIVRYMAENSVGRIWLESYPASSLRADMKYYVKDVEQTEEVQKKLDEIRYKNVNPEDLRIIEPCCGSGHILVYVFDLLFKMYEEKGYLKRDIPTLILKNNLVGLDVDKRASQLASFSLIMKARSINNRFFDEAYFEKPHVYEIKDSQVLIKQDYRMQIHDLNLLSPEERELIYYLVDTFENGKTIGSLLIVKPIDFEMLDNAIDKIATKAVSNLFNIDFLERGVKRLKELSRLAKVLSSKYDVMITNPPYRPISSMESVVSEYATEYYPHSKTDLFAMIMQTGFVKRSGFMSVVNMHSWMFLSSYTKLRNDFNSSYEVISLAQLGPHAFEELNGEVVQTVVFVSRKTQLHNYSMVCDRLVSYNSSVEKENALLSESNRFISQKENFEVIPGKPYAYWISARALETFKNRNLGSCAEIVSGMTTGNNDIYLKAWTEVSVDSIAFNKTNVSDIDLNVTKWIPYHKGGEMRKWYGNHEYVVNWSRSKEFNRAKTTMTHVYLKPCVTWSDISGTSFAGRYCSGGFMFDVKGSCAFAPEDTLKLLLGVFNSKVTPVYVEALNPTTTTQVGDLKRIPLVDPDNTIATRIKELVTDSIELSKSEWDSFEFSWDYNEHPFVKWSHDLWDITAIGANMQYYYGYHPEVKGPLELCYMLWQVECNDRFNKLKANEEELNRIFIDIYGLQNELTPDVADDDVTVRKADLQRDVKSFISYLVGVVMGRYSLDVSGLAYAGGDWDSSKYCSYQPDDDGIVPIYVGVGMEDDLTARIAELVKMIYGEESFKENIDFIAEALGKANNESSMETINRYLNDGFYVDHLKIYQKRPIYWLFSSGKNKGFKCLVYLHRYNRDTLARINAKYYLPESTRQKIELGDIEERIKGSEGKEKIRLEKARAKLFDRYNETIEYGQVLDHMANKYIDIDLDDGVKVNYAKFQGVELVSDSGVKIKKDLLVPLK